MAVAVAKKPGHPFHLNGPENNLRGHQVRHLLDKVIIRPEIHAVNNVLDCLGKILISFNLILVKFWTGSGGSYIFRKSLTPPPGNLERLPRISADS